MSTDTPAMVKAFAEACGQEPGSLLGAEPDSEQLDLIADANDGRLPDDVFRQMRARAREQEGQRGPGRPPGSRNKAHADVAKLICGKYGDPLQFMARVYAMPLDQLTQLLLAAEGVGEREDRLLDLCDKAAEAFATAVREQWGQERLKALGRIVDTLERAASSLKSKPGEIALKALAHQITSANNVAPYVASKKPVEVDHTLKADGVVIMPAPNSQAPVQQVLRNLGNAIADGTVTIDQLRNGEIVDAEYEAVPDEREQDGGE